MDIQTWLLIGLGILFILVLMAYYSPSFAKKVLATASGPFPLTTTQTMISEQDARPYYSESNGSFSTFVYLSPMNRTGSYAACGTNPNQASCSDGTFAPCPCDASTGSCQPCTHIGYNSVFSISGIVGLEVLNAPDASRQGKAMVQLVIKTEGQPVQQGSSASQKYIETITLPPIPLQKWMMVTVAREGRRFDVYYNDSLVLSQKAMYMPVSNISNSSFSGITSGSDGLVGQIALANVYNYRLSSSDIAAKYQEFADTRGRPYINSVANPLVQGDKTGLNPSVVSGNTLSSYLPALSFNLCPSGGCLTPPAIKPASPLYDWTSSYA